MSEQRKNLREQIKIKGPIRSTESLYDKMEKQERYEEGKQFFIDNAIPDDLPDLSNFLNKQEPDEVDFLKEKYLKKDVFNPNVHMLLARNSETGDIIGLGVFHEDKKTLSYLYVAPEYRRHGIAEQLVNNLMQGKKRATAFVRGGIKLVRLLEKHGFRKINSTKMIFEKNT